MNILLSFINYGDSDVIGAHYTVKEVSYETVQ